VSPDQFQQDIHALLGAEALVIRAVGRFRRFVGTELLNALFHLASQEISRHT